jgi:ABC-type phosphate transport system substrate-binding protein
MKGTTVISKKVVALCATVGVVVSGFALAIPAQAEPVSESYTIVGSDTLEDVVGALIQGTRVTGSKVRSLVNNASSGSFDASGTQYIVPRGSQPASKNFGRMGRPNGSGDGRNALYASINESGLETFTPSDQLDRTGKIGVSASVTLQTITGLVDIARASSAGKTSGGSLNITQIPFGRDALGYVYNSVGSEPGIENLTVAQLASIFTGGTVHLGAAAPGGHDIRAVTPQTSSGSGKDWAGLIGVTTANVDKSVSDGLNSVGQEHDASALLPNVVMPMSVSRWIAMNNGASFPKKKQSILMGSIESVPAVTGACAAGADTTAFVKCDSIAPSPAFYYSGETTLAGTSYPQIGTKKFGRDTYLDVEAARINIANVGTTYDADLANLLRDSNDIGLTNYGTDITTAGAVKIKFGFLESLSHTRTLITKG